jgi:hypothetical protein
MGQDVFVDVAYSGLEVGRRLKLREVGPRTAYLEHGTPMPVGAELMLRNGAGLAIPVVVIRVHEQVAGAEMPPGMRIKAEDLAGAAAEWWSGLVSRDDPEIPELPTVIAVPPPGPDLPPIEEEEEEPPPGDTAIMNAAVPDGADEGGNGAPSEDQSPQTSSRTLVMSAVDISKITGIATEGESEDGERDESGEGEAGGSAEAGPSGGNGAPGSNGDELRGGGRRTTRRRRRRRR